MAPRTSFRKEYARMAEVAARKGFCERDMAELFGVEADEVRGWVLDRPEFAKVV